MSNYKGDGTDLLWSLVFTIAKIVFLLWIWIGLMFGD